MSMLDHNKCIHAHLHTPPYPSRGFHRCAADRGTGDIVSRLIMYARQMANNKMTVLCAKELPL